MTLADELKISGNFSKMKASQTKTSSPEEYSLFGHYHRPLTETLQADHFNFEPVIHRLEENGGKVVYRPLDLISEVSTDSNRNAENEIAAYDGFAIKHLNQEQNAVCLEEHLYGRKIVNAALMGLPAFSPITCTDEEFDVARARVCILAHRVDSISSTWYRAFTYKQPDENNAPPDLPAAWSELATEIPFLGIARGKFWEKVHIDVRNSFVAATRVLKSKGLEIHAADHVISDLTQKAASLINNEKQSSEILASLTSLSYKYRETLSHYKDFIILLPAFPTPRAALSKHSANSTNRELGLYELIIPSLLANLGAMTIPCGFSSSGLPISLQLIASKNQVPNALRLATLSTEHANWPTVNSEN